MSGAIQVLTLAFAVAGALNSGLVLAWVNRQQKKECAALEVKLQRTKAEIERVRSALPRLGGEQ